MAEYERLASSIRDLIAEIQKAGVSQTVYEQNRRLINMALLSIANVGGQYNVGFECQIAQQPSPEQESLFPEDATYRKGVNRCSNIFGESRSIPPELFDSRLGKKESQNRYPEGVLFARRFDERGVLQSIRIYSQGRADKLTVWTVQADDIPKMLEAYLDGQPIPQIQHPPEIMDLRQFRSAVAELNQRLGPGIEIVVGEIVGQVSLVLDGTLEDVKRNLVRAGATIDEYSRILDAQRNIQGMLLPFDERQYRRIDMGSYYEPGHYCGKERIAITIEASEAKYLISLIERYTAKGEVTV